MKKILSVLLAAMLVVPAFAIDQEKIDEKAKHDYTGWLPAKGEWYLGFSLNPVATFVGNLFNGTTGNSLGDFAGESLGNNMVSIMGGYMLTDQLSINANIGLSLSRTHNHTYVFDDLALMYDPLSRLKVQDIEHYAKNAGSIALGVEYRVGKRAVQGVFGGGLVYAFAAENTTYNYGNAITEANQKPTIASAISYEAYDSYIPNARPLKKFSTDDIHALGVYATAGFEWFVAPKIALGANVNILLSYSWNPKQYVTYEGWNTLTMANEQVTDLKKPVSSTFSFGTQNIGANLLMKFFF